MTFTGAFQLWIDSRMSISEASKHEYRGHFTHMRSFFGPLPLQEITIHHVNEYRRNRLEQIRARVGPEAGTVTVNKELNMLSQIMRKAGCWDDIGRWYEKLAQPPAQVGIALEPEEEAHLFSVAAKKPKWEIAYLSSLLMRNTGICFGELRFVTLGQIDLDEFSWIRIVKGTKNVHRRRTAYCNGDARWALRCLFRRARRGGCLLPEHYLLPGRGPKPDVQMDRAPYKAWWSLRKKAAEMPDAQGRTFPRLAKVVFYDMRRTAITNLLEHTNVNYNTIEAIAGHRLGSDTKRIYDHLRDENLKRAGDLINSHVRSGL